MIKIFISSPYTIGDTAVNVKRQIDIADELLSAGYAPYVPLLSHFQHMIHPRVYQDWMDNNIVWLNICDCVLRLDGESKGADIECAEAEKLSIPIFYSVSQIKKYYKC